LSGRTVLLSQSILRPASDVLLKGLGTHTDSRTAALFIDLALSIRAVP